MANFKRNIHREYAGIEPFWGRYEELNNVSVPSVSAIQEYQLAKIQMFQEAASREAEKKNAALNALFQNDQINSLPGAVDQDVEIKLDKALTTIVGIMNGTYKSQKGKDSDYKYEELKVTLNYLYDAIQSLNKTIVSNGGTGIPESYLTTVQNAMAACSIGSLNSGVLDEWFKHLNKYKGDLVEDIGVAWLSAKKIPNIMTLNTGALNYQGTKTHKGQIIQDLMMLEIPELDLASIEINYKTPDGNSVTTDLKTFIAAMEAANGEHKQIILQDAGYDTLLELSKLNIQAKAGINQKPWNTNKSTSVSIGEFGNDGMVISARRTFELLHSLDQEHQPEEDWVENSSRDYNLLADYGLATVLFKVLHLGEGGNEYLLTPQGFVTYTDRLKYLMEKGKGRSRIHIQQPVTINNNTLGTVYTVDMTKG